LPIPAAAYMRFGHGATWRSGYATVCKTVYTGSIPVVASSNDIKCLMIVELLRQGGSRKAMRVRRLDHGLLAMPPGREADAREFYRDILGIPEAVKPPELAARGGCWFEDGELKVHLGVEKNFAPERRIRPSSSTIWRD
jgi:hypothetical protein